MYFILDTDSSFTGGLSAHNDGDGVKAQITFMPLVPLQNPGKRARANAKAVSISKFSYFHEDYELRDFLVKIITALDRLDLLEFSWLYNGELDTPNSFTVTYTIPRRVTAQVAIVKDTDYVAMMKEAVKKKDAEIKVFITEHKVCQLDHLLR